MTTETEAVADLAVRGATRSEIIVGAEGRKFLVTPNDANVREVLDDPYGMIVPPPVRIKQSVTVQTAESLVDYGNRFKTGNTVLFADIASNRIKALIDYHGLAEAAHVDHSATLDLPFSEEWRSWTGISGRMFPQAEFARFLEENAPDISSPTGAELLEVCRDLQAARKADFKRVVRTNGEDESFEFTETTDARTKNGSVDVPTKFQLTIPVYFDGVPVELTAFLRWKLDDAALTLGVALHRAEHVRQAEFKRIVLDVAARTERPAVFGKAS